MFGYISSGRPLLCPVCLCKLALQSIVFPGWGVELDPLAAISVGSEEVLSVSKADKSFFRQEGWWEADRQAGRDRGREGRKETGGWRPLPNDRLCFLLTPRWERGGR